jgi:hypothetical protein
VCAGNRQLVTRLRVHRSSLDARCAYVLESGSTIFTWTGTLASKTTAATRAIYLALQLKASRGVGGGLGAAPCNVVAQTQTQETPAFWAALDESQEASGALPASADDVADPSVAFFPHILYKVLGGRVEICGKGDTLHRKALASTAGFVLDTLNAVFCWIGADCGDRDATVASARADELSKKTGRAVVREVDGRESPFFQAQMLGFDDDKIIKEARKVAIGKIDVTKLSPRTLAALASPTRSPAAQPRPQSLPSELSPDLLRRQFESEAAAAAAAAAATGNAAAAGNATAAVPASSSSRGSVSPRAHSPRRSRERQRSNAAAGTVGGGGGSSGKHRRRRSRGRHATLHHESRATNKTQLTAAAIVAAAAAEEAANADSRRTHRAKRSTTTPHGLAASPPAGMSPLLALNIPSGSPSSVAKTFAVLRSPRARMDDSDDDDDDNDANNNMTTDNDNSAKDRDHGESDVAAGDVTLAGGARRASISGARKKLSVDTAGVPAAAAAAAASTSANALDKSLVSSPAPLTGRSEGDSSQIDAAVNLHTRDLREDIGMLRQQINQIESHITLIKLSGRQPPSSGSGAVAATAAATAPPAHPTLPVPNGSVIVRGGNRVVGGAAPVPAEPAPAPTALPATGATPPVVPPLPMAWFYVNLQGGEPFALLGEYRVRVAVAAEDGGDSVLYATRVDSSSLHFDQLGTVRAVNKGQFRWTQNTTNSVVVWIQCRDPNGQLVSNSQPSPRVLGKSASKGAGLTHGVVSQATNVFLSRSSSPTGSPRLQFVETGKSASALSRSTTVAAAEVSGPTSMASSSASLAPSESTPPPQAPTTNVPE